MLQIDGISKSFGPNTVLDKVSFHVNPGEKIALAGPNGSGKSTLLNIVVGDLIPESGSVRTGPGERLCYLRQGITNDDVSVENAACSTVTGAADALQRVRELERQLGSPGSFGPGGTDQMLLERYSDALEQLENCGGQHVLDHLDDALRELDLGDVSFGHSLETLSGGQKSRVTLAGVVAAEPDILLLDEPTNHLDLPALEWLESFVENYPGAALIVSHDRMFLDRTITRIVEIQPDGGIDDFVGNYSQFVAAKDAHRAAQLDRWRAQEAEIRRVRADIARQKQAAGNLENKRKPTDASYKFWAPERIASGLAKRVKSREKNVERFEASEDRVEKPRQQWRMKLDLDAANRSGDLLISIEGATVGYGSTTIYESLSAELRHGERIALMGANGSGKSTLFRLMLGELEPTLGTLRFGTGVSIGYMPQENPVFGESDTPLSYIRSVTDISETGARNFLHYFLFQGDQVFTPTIDLSYGERSRLALSGIVVKEPNLLLLDEPLNHLDIPARERFEEALSQYPGTIIAATHDRTFVDSFATAIWWIEQTNPKDQENQAGRTSRLRKFLDRRELVASGALF